MTGDEEWCVVSPASGDKGVTRVTVAFASNNPAEIEGALPRNALFTFSSGESQKTVVVEQLITIIDPNPNPDAGVNLKIHELLADWYYNGEARDAPADYNQYYDQFFFNFLSRELKRNENFEGNTWAKNGDYYEERYLYSYIERNPTGTALTADLQPPLNYGMEFDLNEYDGRLVGRILYVEPGSPAAAANLKRGDWFYKVNGTVLGNWQTDYGDFGWHYNRMIDTLVNPIEGISPTLGMLSFRAAQRALVDEGVTVTLTPAYHRNPPILGAHVFREERLPENSGDFVNVGYLMYNNFDYAYRDDLEAVFRDVFKPGVGGEPLDAFILDLRYNKNGSVEMAELMGNLLVGNTEGVADKLFSNYEFDKGNPKAPARTEAKFAPHQYGIGVGTVYVITSRYTAGASELLINALRGLDQNVVKLVVVGESTQGLAAGMVKQTIAHPTDPEWEYSAWMLAFRCSNGTEYRDYTWGLVPNGGTVDEWSRDIGCGVKYFSQDGIANLAARAGIAFDSSLSQAGKLDAVQKLMKQGSKAAAPDGSGHGGVA